MKSVIRYILITAFRDLLFIGIFALMLIAVYISAFIGSTALVEQNEMKLALMAGSMRLIIMMGLILFISFHVKRMFDNKEIEVILAGPISRSKFIFAYWLSFVVLMAILVVPSAFTVLVFNDVNKIGMLYWSCSIILEAGMIIAYTILSSLILKSAVNSALSGIAFYFIGRMMGFFTGFAQNKYHFSVEGVTDWLGQWMLTISSIFIPRLDLFAKSSWLVYGIQKQHDMWLIFVQSAVFIPLLLCVAFYDFKRKQF